MKHNQASMDTKVLDIKRKAETAFSGPADLVVAVLDIKRDLKALLEKVEALNYALLAQDNGPKDIFELLANNACQFLSVDDLAKLLNVDRRTIYSLRSKGLPFYKIGKELRFDPLEVAAWLKESQKK